MIPKPAHIEMTPPHASPADQASLLGTDSVERQAEQGNATQARAGRSRYVSIAWYVYTWSDFMTRLLIRI